MFGRFLLAAIPVLRFLGTILGRLANTTVGRIVIGMVTETFLWARPYLEKTGFGIATVSFSQFILNLFGTGGASTRERLVKAGMSQWLAVYAGIGQIFGLLGAIKDLTAAELMYDLNRFMRFVKYDDPHEFLTKEEIINQYLRGNIDTEKYLDEMQYLGFSASIATDIAYNATIQPTVGDLIENWKRDGDGLYPIEQRLEQIGLSPEAIRIAIRNSYKILTIDQLLTARTKGHIKDDPMFYKMGKQLGYEQPELDLLQKANGDPISVGQAFDWWNRVEGAKSIPAANRNNIEQDYALYETPENIVDDALDQGTLNLSWYKIIKSLRYQMLGASDYIRFAVRDVYNIAVRAANRLDEGYPDVLAAKLKMLGYSPQDAKDAWAAHWELPSPTQVFEMLHRGKLPPGISVDDYLVSADYAPAWRQALTDISYNPITRTDAKRMYKLRGDFDELVRHFKDNGYSDQDANDLAEFTRQDVNLEGNNERSSLSSGLKNAVLSMYKGRTISADEVRDVLRQLTYTDETIEQFILEADFFRIQDEKADVAGALKAAYVKALRSRDDTVALLQQAGWNGQPLQDLMGTWDLLRAATELQPHQGTTRDLTKTELLNAYEDNIITDVEVVDGLIALGYDNNEATTLKAHSDLKRKKAENAMQQELVHQRYIGREITYDTASIELDKYNVPVTQKLILLKKWTVELEKRVPDFTLTQLEGMVRAKVMDESVARRFLRDQGYMDSQVEYLTSWWLGKKLLFETGKGKTLLRRSDVEGMYIDNRDKRAEAIDLFRQLGYSNSNINVILDSIDQNLNRTIGPKLP